MAGSAGAAGHTVVRACAAIAAEAAADAAAHRLRDTGIGATQAPTPLREEPAPGDANDREKGQKDPLNSAFL